MSEVKLHTITTAADLPAWAPAPTVVEFFHTTMHPYQDTPEDIERGLGIRLFERPWARRLPRAGGAG